MLYHATTSHVYKDGYLLGLWPIVWMVILQYSPPAGVQLRSNVRRYFIFQTKLRLTLVSRPKASRALQLRIIYNLLPYRTFPTLRKREKMTLRNSRSNSALVPCKSNLDLTARDFISKSSQAAVLSTQPRLKSEKLKDKGMQLMKIQPTVQSQNELQSLIINEVGNIGAPPMRKAVMKGIEKALGEVGSETARKIYLAFPSSYRRWPWCMWSIQVPWIP